jgi:hypothetical protein
LGQDFRSVSNPIVKSFAQQWFMTLSLSSIKRTVPQKINHKGSVELYNSQNRNNTMATTDEILNLLKAVNEITLKRIEDKVDAVNAITLKRIEDKVDAVNAITLKRIEDEILAIKAKVGA